MFKAKFPWKQVAVATVVGIALGAASALLFAPMTGKKMQKQLKSSFDDGIQGAEKLMKKVVNA